MQKLTILSTGRNTADSSRKLLIPDAEGNTNACLQKAAFPEAEFPQENEITIKIARYKH